MRLATILLAALIAAPSATLAQSDGLPGHTLGEAGEASVIGVFVCGLPPSSIDEMKTNVDRFVAGGSTSADFAKGQAQATRSIQDIRDSSVPDFSEMRAGRCSEVTALRKDISVTR